MSEKKKIFLVHADSFLNKDNFEKWPSQKIVVGNIKALMLGVENSGKKTVRIDSTVDNPDKNADFFIIGNDVSAKRALEVIQPGEEIWLAGFYKDVCLNMIFEEAMKIGAKPKFIPGTSLEQSKIADWDEPDYLKMLENETKKFAQNLKEISL